MYSLFWRFWSSANLDHLLGRKLPAVMEEGTPTKPPRGRPKQTKESSSNVLMSVIRELCSSESEEQREREKAKLEKDYKRSDKKLEDLVSKYGDELSRVMQTFGKVSTQITSSRDKMRNVKERLEECKVLLRCRREELRKQWLEGVELKHALQLLDDIAQLREVPGQLTQQLARKQYVTATQCLNAALASSEGQLAGIEALRDVRAELHEKKGQLYNKLMDELRQHVYVVPAADVINFRRQGSGKEPGLSPFQRGYANLRGSKGARAKRKLLDVPNRGDQGDVDYAGEDETDDLDPQERAEVWFTTVTECLCAMSKMSDAIEMIKTQMQSELSEIISRSTQHVLESCQTVDGAGERVLVELLETVVEQFRRVAAAHATLLRCISKACTKYNVAVRLYDVSDVWNKVQEMMKLWLSEYIDAGVAGGDARDTPSFTQPVMDISSYFARRKPTKQKKVHLFRFDRSASAHCVATESKQHGFGQQTLVCPADIKNVKVIFSSLSRLMDELEQSGPRPCLLHKFLDTYISQVFLKTHHSKLSQCIEAATKGPDAWKIVTDASETKKMGLSRPLLQSTVTVERTVVEVRQLIRSLPEFADRLLWVLCHLLGKYYEVCQAAYRGIVQPDSEDKRIFSSAWLKDEDINRFIKSLPNWAELQAHKPTHRSRRLRREETTEEESPEDIRQRNVKEAVMLSSNIGEGGIHRHELLSDIGQLKKLAQLHESMEWFSAQVLLVAGDLKEVKSGEKPKCEIPQETEQKLFQLVHDFTDLADICLLVLHLEVRVQCFHYLLSKSATMKKYDPLYQEPDHKVVELSRVLTATHEAMTTSLQPRKTKYIFEGLGYLIAKILISSAQYLQRIDEIGVEHICRNIFALQQTLSNMTMTRDLALDHAKHYFDLFHLTPDEVLAGVVERGAQFADMEYINALQLLHRSHPDAYGAVERHLERLSDILGETGVTV